ncbi:RNA polymerase sigma factor [Gluconacetobacter liquefaciens]|nr:RNA polymerase sigma factor [Gluconacetobacter liquefaciens]
MPSVTALDAPVPDGADLSALIARVAASRDRTAYAALFKYFAPRVKAYLRRAGMEGAEAEEATQDVMLIVWRKADRFDPARAGATTWVFAIARNVRIDHLRRRNSGAASTMPELDTEEHAPSAETLMLADEREERIRMALDGLTDEQREIVRLSFFSETPHAAISSALALPLGTVKSRIRLAMVKLRAAIGNDS